MLYAVARTVLRGGGGKELSGAFRGCYVMLSLGCVYDS